MDDRGDLPRYSRVACGVAAGSCGVIVCAPPSQQPAAFLPMPSPMDSLPAAHHSDTARLEPAASDSWLAALSQLNHSAFASLPHATSSPATALLAAPLAAPQPRPQPLASQPWQQRHAAAGAGIARGPVVR
jgi:hypothetical protein